MNLLLSVVIYEIKFIYNIIINYKNIYILNYFFFKFFFLFYCTINFLLWNNDLKLISDPSFLKKFLVITNKNKSYYIRN